jgi:hypothetical protein
VSYVVSKSLNEFRKKLRDLTVVAGKATKIRSGGKYKKVIEDSLLSSTLLLGYAHFQDYIESVVEDVCEKAANAECVAANLPAHTRMHSTIVANLKAWIKITDQVGLLDKLANSESLGAFDYLVPGSLVKSNLAGILLSDTAYPSPENLRKLFRRLGIKDVFSEMDRVSKKNTGQLLRSLHDARATLAHEGVPPGWAPSDFAAKLADLTTVAGSIDRVFSKWTTANVGRACWVYI